MRPSIELSWTTRALGVDNSAAGCAQARRTPRFRVTSESVRFDRDLRVEPGADAVANAWPLQRRVDASRALPQCARKRAASPFRRRASSRNRCPSRAERLGTPGVARCRCSRSPPRSPIRRRLRSRRSRRDCAALQRRRTHLAGRTRELNIARHAGRRSCSRTSGGAALRAAPGGRIDEQHDATHADSIERPSDRIRAMRILISNDDGHFSPGIRLLAERPPSRGGDRGRTRA